MAEDKIQTAEEMFTQGEIHFLETSPGNLDSVVLKENVASKMIEFAKLHCNEMLKAILQKGKVFSKETNEEVFIGWGGDRSPVYGKKMVHSLDKNSIINAYNIEENVK